MGREEDKPSLKKLINTACPRTNIGLIDHTLGSLEIVFADNLEKLDIRAFSFRSGDQEVHFYAESANPSVFVNSDSLQIKDKADYATIRYTDSTGATWTIEAFHPKFQDQDIGINRTDGQRTDRFMYCYSPDQESLYLSKINVSLRADSTDRFNHDTVSVRIPEDSSKAEVRLRINQNTTFQRDPAKQIREHSTNYHDVTQFDGSHVLSTYVNIAAKIVLGYAVDFHEEADRFEDYVATFELMKHFYLFPKDQEFTRQLVPVALHYSGELATIIDHHDRVLRLANDVKTLLRVDGTEIVNTKFIPVPPEDGQKKDIERLFQFGRAQIEGGLQQQVARVITTE